ncbi:hypothetical protein [Oleiphilus sp. HI0125]|uniref:hypothetical protein n=1 Tax=Oleiphilus sp. HI0125 TaxID=1822266 RepID=UPI000A699713|nr:hypothetical protein [Oleiphilus sp. HI0125]
MITPIQWIVSDDSLAAAIEWASKKLNYSIDRPNMNARDISEALDDKIMGDIATIAVAEFIRSRGYQAVAYDQIRNDSFQEPDPGWDLAIGIKGLNEWARSTSSPKLPPKEKCLTVSVRSSRLVRDEPISEAISQRDFKIFALNPKNIGTDLTADIETQVYYPLANSQLNGRSINHENVVACCSDRSNCNEILSKLDIRNRYGECTLTAWDYSNRIHHYSQSIRTKTWSSFGKKMWIAPLRNGMSFESIFQELSKFGNKI